MTTGVAVVGDDLAAGLRDRLVGRGHLGRDAAVDLRARVGVEVEAGARLHGRDRVGAGRHGLRLQRLERPRGRRLVRHHAAQVGVQRQRVDGVDAGERARREVDRAAVGAADAPVGRAPAQRHDPAPAGHPQRRVSAHPLAARRAQLDAAAVAAHVVGLARRQPPPPCPHRAGEGGRAAHRLQQHAHALVAVDVPERGARVVVAEDVAVAGAVLREPVGAVLAHAHPVAEAGAADRELRGSDGVPAGTRASRKRVSRGSGRAWKRGRGYVSPTRAMGRSFG